MHALKDILYFVGVTVVFRFLFLNWLTTKIVELSERLTTLLERWLVKNEREAIEWWHYRERAAKSAHQPTTPLQCQDGKCVDVVR